MPNSLISILSGFPFSHDFNQKISGIIKGEPYKLIQYLEKMAVSVERLSERILYIPNAISVQDVSQSRQQYINDLREVRASLEPTQRAIGEQILSSAMILTPEKMQKAFTKNPWEVLMDVRPLNLAISKFHTDMTPVLFSHEGMPFIGWQMCGVLPQLFDCQYNELWMSNLSNSQLPLVSSDSESESLPENLPRLPQQTICTLQGHKDWVNSIALSPDGHTLASGGEDKTVKLWNINTGQEIRTLKKGWWYKGHDAPVRTVAFSPDGQTLASGSDDNTIKLWEVSTGKIRRILHGEGYWVRTVAFSPDGKFLASECETIKLWEVSTGKEFRTFKGFHVVVFSPDGRTLATAGVNNTIKLWEVSTGKEIHTFKRHRDYVTSIAFSPDGQMLASGSEDQTIKLWDIKTGKEICTLQGHKHSIGSVAFHPSGHALASASADKTIKLWEISTHCELFTLQGHECMVNSIVFSSDGLTLATASNDKNIKLWQ